MNNSVVILNNPFSALFEGLGIDPSLIFVVIFLIACLLFSTMSTVLLYHWSRYGMNNQRIVWARIIYIVVSLIIIGVSFGALAFM